MRLESAIMDPPHREKITPPLTPPSEAKFYVTPPPIGLDGGVLANPPINFRVWETLLFVKHSHLPKTVMTL